MVALKNKLHLFFDLDDTLWDFEKNSALVLEQVYNVFGLREKLNVDFETFLFRYKEINLALWSKYYRREIDKAYLRNHRFNETFKFFGYDNYAENLEVTDIYLNQSPKGNLLKEGCLDTLTYLAGRYRLHIITNGFKEVQHVKLEGSGIKHFFDQVIISEEHGLVKPDEKIFRLAENMAATSREYCVMIGDSFESDISGALNAGWEAIHLTQEKTEHFKGTAIRRLEELTALF